MKTNTFFLTVAAAVLLMTNIGFAQDKNQQMRAEKEALAMNSPISQTLPVMPLRYTVNYAVGCNGGNTETVVSILNRSGYSNYVYIKYYDWSGSLIGSTEPFALPATKPPIPYIFATASSVTSPFFSFVDASPVYDFDPCSSFVGYAEIYAQRTPIQVGAWMVSDGQATSIPVQTGKSGTGNN